MTRAQEQQYTDPLGVRERKGNQEQHGEKIGEWDKNYAAILGI